MAPHALPRIFVSFLVFALASPACVPPEPSAGPLDVGVTLRETAGVPRAAELVSFGLPVARAAGLTTVDGLVVTGSDGEPRPSQFRVTSRWGAPPEVTGAPIRWLLVHVLVDLPAGGRRTLHVRSGVAAPASALGVLESADAVRVDTGALVATISRRRGSVLESVVRAGEEVLDAGAPHHGVRVTTLDGSVLATARDARVLATDVIERGPVVTTVRQQLEIDDVRLRDESGEAWEANACFPWLYPCSELHRYRLRVSLFSTFVAGSDAIRLRARVENVSVCPVTEDGAKHCSVEGSLHSVGFRDLTLHLALARPTSAWEAGGAPRALGAAVVVHQDSSGLESWDAYRRLGPVQGYTPGGWEDRGPANVSFRGFRATEGGATLASGDRMPGWLTVRDGAYAVSVAVADAWKHFPLALRARPSAVEIGLYPDEFAADHSLRPGERKTHELALAFGDTAATDLARRAHAWVERPIRFAWDPGYGVETRAVPGLSRAGIEPDYDLWNRASVDVAVSEAHDPNPWYVDSSLLLARDRSALWGKKEAGYLPNDNEAETSTDLSKYLQYHGFLLQALRNAGADDALADVWWEIGVDANRAQADSGYLMTPYAVQDSSWPGINLAHCFHENAENRTFPRGGGFGCDFAGDVTGMSLLYVLTGFDPAMDAIEAHAGHVRREALRTARYDREVRSYASRIEVLVAAWELSGDAAHLVAARRLLDVMEAGDGLAYLACPCPGAPASHSLNALFAGWLLRSLGRLADAESVVSGTGSTSYARARALLDAHADWYAREVVFTAPSPVGAGLETVVPYAWYLDGRASNREPVSAGYGLMAVDGLAAAARLSGNAGYRSVADGLFRTILRMPFYFGSWPRFVYSTINDAGKLATFGGAHVEARADDLPQRDRVSLRVVGHAVLEASGALVAGDVVVSRGATGITAIHGGGEVASAGSERSVRFDLDRDAGTGALAGSVSVEADEGTVALVTVAAASATGPDEAVALSGWTVDATGPGPLWGTLRATILDAP